MFVDSLIPSLLFISWADFGWIALGLFIMFNFLAIVVLSLTWLERKTLGRLQRRLGPTRSGPMGLLQPVADGIKLLIKEDITPTSSEKAIFWAAPVIVVLSAFMIWVTIPGAQNAVIKNLDLGLFYIIAFSTIGILGLVLGGWGSANKYGTLGGLRAAAQLVSYEIPIIMVAVSIAMLAQSLDLREIVAAQGSYPFVLVQPLGLVIFFIAGLAEVGRTPFDIYHAESEIVGGPFVEYSGAHWSVFFLAEYINTFAIAALTVILFFGGVGRTGAGRLVGGHLVPLQGVPCASGNFLDPGHLPAAAHRPAHGLCLEGGCAAFLPDGRYHRDLPVLQLAGLVAYSDVPRRPGAGGLRDLPQAGRACQPGSPGARAPGGPYVRPRRQSQADVKALLNGRRLLGSARAALSKREGS